MTQIQLDANLARQFKSSANPLELCDPNGTVVGVFTPVKESKIEIPFTEEEIQTSKQEKSGRPLAEIMADLTTRSVSVFWTYLVVIFGVIAICPFYYYEKGETLLPVGTVYVNYPSPDPGTLLLLLCHTAGSIILAGAATLLHKKLAPHFSLEKKSLDRTESSKRNTA